MNNKGFTLIEMIISTAILGIVALAAAGFVATGARTYRQVNDTIQLQYESQLAMTQMQEYVIDCNTAMSWDGAVLTVVNTDGADQTVHVFAWDGSAIRYGTGPVADTLADAADLMADRVTEMEVSFQKTTDDRAASAVSIRLTMERNGKSYTGTQTIALRNQPKPADDWSELLDIL